MNKTITLLAAAILLAVFSPGTASAQPGSLDASFGTGGKTTTAFGALNSVGTATAIQSDGKILVAGNAGDVFSGNYALARYNTNGSLDNTFGTGGTVADVAGAIYAIAIQSDGKIVVAGMSPVQFQTGSIAISLARYTASGVLDNTFSGGTVSTTIGTFAEAGNSLAIQTDGKIVLAGYSKSDFSVTDSLNVIRYNADGSLDNTFGASGIVATAFGSSDNIGYSVALQTDGKIVVAGVSGFDIALARYTTTGVLDNTFGTAGKVTTDFLGDADAGYSVSIQSDGKIVVAGSTFVNFTAKTDFAIVRYNSDGSLDNTFGSAGKVSSPIGSAADVAYSTVIQTDGKIILAGYTIAGVDSDFALVRYTNTGTLDNTFGTAGIVTTNFGAGNDVGLSVKIQSDGKIVVAGTSGGNFAVARYNGDGASCPSITATVTQLTSSSARVAATGGATPYTYSWNTTPVQTVATATGLSAGNTYTVIITDNNGCTGTASISIIPSGIASIGEEYNASLYPNPATNQLSIQTNGMAVTEINIYNSTGGLVSKTKQSATNIVDVSELNAGVYIAEIKIGNTSVKRRWLKM